MHEPSRRQLLRTGAVAAGIGAIAGCLGGGGNGGDSRNGNPDDGTNETGAETEGESDDDTSDTDRKNRTDGTGGSDENEGGEDAGTRGDESDDAEDGGYSVTMEPVGEVEFEAIPETWLSYTGDYADMGVALGQGDGLSAVGVRARFGSHLYEELPGVSVEDDDLTELYQNGTGKEVFHELDADVHLIDPNFMVNRLQWSESDVEKIAQTVGPFVGNTIFSRVYDWHDYPHYTLYEAFETVAEVFGERERYEAFAAYHDEVLADVRGRLPEETPDVAVVYPADVPPESFYPYRIGEGTQSKHWTDLEVGDALADVTDAQAGGGEIDYETLLEIDPDALAIRLQGAVTPDYFEREIVSHLESHDVASRLRAVSEGRVVYGGLTYQGPIIHLFQLERAARDLYPDSFGDGQLFDRERVAGIVTGDA
ncbi:ABC transporter substrate-binding protein [Saliphagus infecundisoli]|uniref:ABC transporter substrate-binding protein n=1 Tax=Saliphagus infecundisoli TaxID=1849069 RepID=A0ABD5QBN6_9EURY|nr:ABC transporter substrate-binding protein [Saliphagus infecundisoli]